MLLTMKEKHRIDVITAVMDGKIEVSEAGRVLERSTRQVYRVVKRVRERGVEGVIHGNRGKESPRNTRKNIRDRILTLAEGKYQDTNDAHFKDLLFKREDIDIGRETLRGILRKAWIPPKRTRRRSKYRKRRERKEVFGMMLQIDASTHDWLEGRGPSLTLVAAIDDATGYVWGRFVTERDYLGLPEPHEGGYGVTGASFKPVRRSAFNFSSPPGTNDYRTTTQ